jgi:hypothetical protein
MLKIEVFTRLVIENQYFDIVFYSSRLFAGGSVMTSSHKNTSMSQHVTQVSTLCNTNCRLSANKYYSAKITTEINAQMILA